MTAKIFTYKRSKVKQASSDNLVALETWKVPLLASSFCTWLLEEEFHQGGKTSDKCSPFSVDPVHLIVCSVCASYIIFFAGYCTV